MLSELFLLIVTSSLFLCMWELYSVTPLSLFSLWVYCSIISLFQQTLPRDFLLYDLMLMACHYSQRYHLLSTVSLSFHVIFPVYLLSNFNLLRSRILFFFLLAGAHCPDTYSNRPVFITWRSKVWAKHWLLWWREQNGMDFHLYSKMWLQQYVCVFIRRGQEVIHHSTTWEHLTNTDTLYCSCGATQAWQSTRQGQLWLRW